MAFSAASPGSWVHGGHWFPFLEQATLRKAVVPSVPDDHVIEGSNPDDLSRLDQSAGDLAIVLARRRVTARIVNMALRSYCPTVMSTVGAPDYRKNEPPSRLGPEGGQEAVDGPGTELLSPGREGGQAVDGVFPVVEGGKFGRFVPSLDPKVDLAPLRHYTL